MTLRVRITRAKRTRILRAHIIQHGGDGEIAGDNLLQGHSIARIETAKELIGKTLRWPYGELEFEVLASPDAANPYRVGEDRNAVRREVES